MTSMAVPPVESDPLFMYRPLIINDPTAPSAAVMALFPSADAGPVEPPHIATLEELMASHSATVAKEAADTEALSSLVSPTREALRPQLFQWATVGFPDLYVVLSFTIAPPAICADGVTREIGKYIEYCIEKNLGEVIDGLKALMVGIQPSWSVSGNTLRIHVSKA
jgi:hypothetical protein